MARDVCLIVNPSAGGGRGAKRLPAVEAVLRSHGMRFRVERTTSLDHARELARSTIEREEIAASLGGDGLAGAVAGELRGSRGILGVLPGGRGNDFARKLGISQDAAQAAEVLASGAIREVDVAVTAAGHAYLGIASAGLDSDVQDIALATKLKLGSLVYLYGTLRVLAKWKPATWTVTVDGEQRSFCGYSVAVANSGMYGGGMKLVPDASLDDGMLDIVLCGESTKRAYLAGLPKVFKGTHVSDPALTFLKGREVSFESDRPYVAYADGDPIADLPCTITVEPRALRVLAP
jgi:YegS/Rv2252/BmrU family lipid kinase